MRLDKKMLTVSNPPKLHRPSQNLDTAEERVSMDRRQWEMPSQKDSDEAALASTYVLQEHESVANRRTLFLGMVDRPGKRIGSS